MPDLVVGHRNPGAKLVQAAAGVRAIPEARTKLEHELADCLWSLLVLAQKLDVDLEAAFESAMTGLKRAVRSQLAAEEGSG